MGVVKRKRGGKVEIMEGWERTKGVKGGREVLDS